MSKPGQLVLVRHGESTYNAASRFTGLLDVDLTPEGERQARTAGALLRGSGVTPDLVVLSPMRRSRHTAELMALGEIPTEFVWELAERDYGSLTGQPKAEVRERLGEERFFAWRRTINGCPPAASAQQRAGWDDPGDYGSGGRLRLGMGESLQDVIDRIEPWWWREAVPVLAGGASVLVVAHGNSLRALVAVFTLAAAAEIEHLNIPTAQPLCFMVDTDGRPLGDGRYLDGQRAEAAAAALAADGGT